MRSLIFFSLSCALTLNVSASEKTDRNWEQLLLSKNLPATEQSYCYTDETGQLHGKNTAKPVRLASVSKLITSLWAIDKLGADYKFNTKLHIKGDNLHIAGSHDPFFGSEKIFFLISKLNDLGINEFDRVTFNKGTQFFPGAQLYTEQFPSLSPDLMARDLKLYLNTDNWTPAMKKDYARVAALAKDGVFRKEVTFKTESVAFSESNPFDLAENAVRTLTLSSPPLFRYLKEINVQSNNYAAQALFLNLGGEKEFKSYLLKKFNIDSQKIRFWTGSGLPLIINGTRFDNYGTCSSVSHLIAALKMALEDEDRNLEDIVAVPGSDGGTFSNRVFPSEYTNAFVAKTGTLMHTSTLAGAMKTQKGFTFYGIFNQSTDIVNSKIVQNEMVKSIMTEMGGPLAFKYVVLPFETYGANGLKNLLLPRSDFLPVPDDLY